MPDIKGCMFYVIFWVAATLAAVLAFVGPTVFSLGWQAILFTLMVISAFIAGWAKSESERKATTNPTNRIQPKKKAKLE